MITLPKWAVRPITLSLMAACYIALIGSDCKLGGTYEGGQGGQPPPQTGCPQNACYRRAHTTTCTNADGSPSTTVSMCADGCAATCEEAETKALQGLGTQTCLGSANGCCEYVVDQDFNVCGK